MLFGGVNCRETSARVIDNYRVTKENLILGSNIIEDRRDCGQTNVERIQRMFHDRPQLKLQQELQTCITSRQLATPKSDDVENRLTNRVENDVSFWIFVAIEVANLDVIVRPVAELF